MVQAARVAAKSGYPINRLLTIRTSAMRRCGGGGILRNGTQTEGLRDFLDKLYRWCLYRSVPVEFIWVREFGAHHGEHLHLGYHMRPCLDDAFANQLANWLDENKRVITRTEKADGLIAVSDENSWHIAGCIQGNTSGEFIAAYLGKSEPNEIRTAWGYDKRNKQKYRRRLTSINGPIEGTYKHHYRWGTSLLVGRTQRDRESITPH